VAATRDPADQRSPMIGSVVAEEDLQICPEYFRLAIAIGASEVSTVALRLRYSDSIRAVNRVHRSTAHITSAFRYWQNQRGGAFI